MLQLANILKLRDRQSKWGVEVDIVKNCKKRMIELKENPCCQIVPISCSCFTKLAVLTTQAVLAVRWLSDESLLFQCHSASCSVCTRIYYIIYHTEISWNRMGSCSMCEQVKATAHWFQSVCRRDEVSVSLVFKRAGICNLMAKFLLCVYFELLEGNDFDWGW